MGGETLCRDHPLHTPYTLPTRFQHHILTFSAFGYSTDPGQGLPGFGHSFPCVLSQWHRIPGNQLLQITISRVAYLKGNPPPTVACWLHFILSWILFVYFFYHVWQLLLLTLFLAVLPLGLSLWYLIYFRSWPLFLLLCFCCIPDYFPDCNPWLCSLICYCCISVTDANLWQFWGPGPPCSKVHTSLWWFGWRPRGLLDSTPQCSECQMDGDLENPYLRYGTVTPYNVR